MIYLGHTYCPFKMFKCIVNIVNIFIAHLFLYLSSTKFIKIKCYKNFKNTNLSYLHFKNIINMLRLNNSKLDV